MSNKQSYERKRIPFNPELLIKLYKAGSFTPLMVFGPPGIGKSSIIKEAAKKLGIKTKDIRLTYFEPVDLVGYPMPNKETKVTEMFTSALFATDDDGDPIDKDWKGFILFDELPGVDKNMQQACYQIFLDREANGWKLPEGAMCIAAGNEEDSFAVFNPISSALISRMRPLYVRSDTNQWLNWALQNNVHSSVWSFINKNKASLFSQPTEESSPFACPRSWTDLSDLLSVPNLTEEELNALGPGKIGNQLWIEFKVLHAMLSRLTDPEDYLTLKVNLPKVSDDIFYLALVSTARLAHANGRYEEYFNLIKHTSKLKGAEEVVMQLNSMIGIMNPQWYSKLQNKTKGDYIQLALSLQFPVRINGQVVYSPNDTSVR